MTMTDLANWICGAVVAKQIQTKKRFGWLKCEECANFDPYRSDGGAGCDIVGRTTGDAYCNLWRDIFWRDIS